MNYEDKFRGYSAKGILEQLINIKKHNFCNQHVCCLIQRLIKILINQSDIKTLNMLYSEDVEISYLAIQLLFEEHIDYYNILCENKDWERLVKNIIIDYKYYMWTK